MLTIYCKWIIMFKLVWEFEWKNVQYIECRVYFRCDGECSGDL